MSEERTPSFPYYDQLARGRGDRYALKAAADTIDKLIEAEEKRILLASEDEIRKEMLADGLDPDEYLRACDTSMRMAFENAVLTVDFRSARALLIEAKRFMNAQALTEEETEDFCRRLDAFLKAQHV